MADIQVRTVDSMQGCQAKCIIFDIVASKHIGFMWLKNRVNIACSRAMDGMVFLADVCAMLCDSHLHRKHISNVFTYLIECQWRRKVINTASN